MAEEKLLSALTGKLGSYIGSKLDKPVCGYLEERLMKSVGGKIPEAELKKAIHDGSKAVGKEILSDIQWLRKDVVSPILHHKTGGKTAAGFAEEQFHSHYSEEKLRKRVAAHILKAHPVLAEVVKDI